VLIEATQGEEQNPGGF